MKHGIYLFDNARLALEMPEVADVLIGARGEQHAVVPRLQTTSG